MTATLAQKGKSFRLPLSPFCFGVFCLSGLLIASTLATAGEPYDLETGREFTIYGLGLAGGLGARYALARQEPLTPEEILAHDASRVNGLDRVATRMWSESADKASDMLLYGMTAAPLLLLLETGAGMNSGEMLVMYSQTQLAQVATVGLTKALVRRPRPYVYNRDPRIPVSYREDAGARRSFPSGHTSATFAAAVFMGEVYARLNPDRSARHWVRGGSLALAATTGFLRVRAGRHFPTDVLAGAAIGALAGWAIPQLHEVDPETGGGGAAKASIAFGFAF
jgi:membrane-associated phospholipid phosphatase